MIHEVWAFGQYCLPKVSNGFKLTPEVVNILALIFVLFQVVCPTVVACWLVILTVTEAEMARPVDDMAATLLAPPMATATAYQKTTTKTTRSTGESVVVTLFVCLFVCLGDLPIAGTISKGNDRQTPKGILSAFPLDQHFRDRDPTTGLVADVKLRLRSHLSMITH